MVGSTDPVWWNRLALDFQIFPAPKRRSICCIYAAYMLSTWNLGIHLHSEILGLSCQPEMVPNISEYLVSRETNSLKSHTGTPKCWLFSPLTKHWQILSYCHPVLVFSENSQGFWGTGFHTLTALTALSGLPNVQARCLQKLQQAVEDQPEVVLGILPWVKPAKSGDEGDVDKKQVNMRVSVLICFNGCHERKWFLPKCVVHIYLCNIYIILHIFACAAYICTPNMSSRISREFG